MHIELVAQKTYEAFRAHDKTCVPWEELPEEHKQAWRSAAHAAANNSPAPVVVEAHAMVPSFRFGGAGTPLIKRLQADFSRIGITELCLELRNWLDELGQEDGDYNLTGGQFLVDEDLKRRLSTPEGRTKALRDIRMYLNQTCFTVAGAKSVALPIPIVEMMAAVLWAFEKAEG